MDGIKGMTIETSGYTVITYDLTKMNMDKIKDTLHKLNDEVTDEQEITRRCAGTESELKREENI